MWVEELRMDNIKCFGGSALSFTKKDGHYRWVTFLSENGGGKSTALQALALLLAGPESVQKLAPRPVAWLRDESKAGLISTRIHKGDNDFGKFGAEKETLRAQDGHRHLSVGSTPISLERVGNVRSVKDRPFADRSARRRVPDELDHDDFIAADRNAKHPLRFRRPAIGCKTSPDVEPIA